MKKDVDTTQELADLANDYKTFADSKDGVEAKTKFIMIIDWISNSIFLQIKIKGLKIKQYFIIMISN